MLLYVREIFGRDEAVLQWLMEKYECHSYNKSADAFLGFLPDSLKMFCISLFVRGFFVPLQRKYFSYVEKAENAQQ